jgi:simple sugar transport system permease protein
VTIPASAQLPRLVAGSQLTIGLFIAVGAAVLLKVLLTRSVLGYEIRAVGLNAQAAEAKGISQVKVWLLAMAIGGALAGLAGATEVLGIHRRFVEGFSPGYGFDGIAVALMGYSDPLGAIAAALVIGAIRTGAMVMDRATRIPVDFVVVIQGLLLIFLAVPGLLHFLRRRNGEIEVKEGIAEDGS